MTIYVDNATIEKLLTTFQRITAVSSTTAAAGTLALTVASNEMQVITGTAAGQIVKLPDATTLAIGQNYSVVNTATVSVAVQDGSSAPLVTVQPQQRVNFILLGTGTAAGLWTYTTIDQSMASSDQFACTFPGTGLVVSYQAGIAYLNGIEYSIAAGTVTVAPSITGGFIYVDAASHVVTSGSTLPNNSVPMATFTSGVANITALNDARENIDRNLVWGITSDIQAQTSQATGSAGALERYARADHVHPMNVNLMKAGVITAVSFAGNPKAATVTFATAFASTAYSIHLTGQDGRSWIYTNKLAASFIANAQANQALTGEVSWFAVATGEAA